MKYRGVLYDMDGTVLNTLDDLTDAVNYTLRHFGMPERSELEVRRFLGSGARKLMSLSVPEGTDDDTLERVLAFYLPYYNAHCRIKTAPYTGISALMEKLNAAGVTQAVISNKPDDSVRELAHDFFGGKLTLAVGESAAVRCKPHPDMVLAAVRELGLTTAECVYVGDSEVDIATAKNAGMDCISVAWGFRDEPELAAAGAKCIVHSADELYEKLR